MTPITLLPYLQDAASASVAGCLPTFNHGEHPAHTTQRSPDPFLTSQPDQIAVRCADDRGESSPTLQTRMTLLNRL